MYHTAPAHLREPAVEAGRYEWHVSLKIERKAAGKVPSTKVTLVCISAMAHPAVLADRTDRPKRRVLSIVTLKCISNQAPCRRQIPFWQETRGSFTVSGCFEGRKQFCIF